VNIEVTFGVHGITETSITQRFRLEAWKKHELLVDLCYQFPGKPERKYDMKAVYVFEILGSHSGVVEGYGLLGCDAVFLGG
jgi:hypothetical protein